MVMLKCPEGNAISFKNISIAIAVALFLFYFMLIASLFGFMDRATFFSAISSERVWYSIKLSFFTAAAAAFLSVLVAIPAAYARAITFQGRLSLTRFSNFRS